MTKKVLRFHLGRIERFIVQQLIEERYVLTLHARLRMAERSISDGDIMEMARTLTSIVQQGDTYLFRGLDSWGTCICASVALKEYVIVVTVFHGESQ